MTCAPKSRAWQGVRRGENRRAERAGRSRRENRGAQARIDAGKYKVDPHAVADRMVDEHLQASAWAEYGLNSKRVRMKPAPAGTRSGGLRRPMEKPLDEIYASLQRLIGLHRQLMETCGWSARRSSRRISGASRTAPSPSRAHRIHPPGRGRADEAALASSRPSGAGRCASSRSARS